jgi:hypothetical protein
MIVVAAYAEEASRIDVCREAHSPAAAVSYALGFNNVLIQYQCYSAKCCSAEFWLLVVCKLKLCLIRKPNIQWHQAHTMLDET